MNKLLLGAVTASTFALFASSAPAAVLPSLSRATFQAAIAGASTLGYQNFDSIAVGTVLTTLDGVTYGSSTGSPFVTASYLTSTGLNGLGATGIGYFQVGDTATFTFASAVTAFAIDVNTYATADGAYVATLNTGDTSNSIFEVFPGVGTGQFLGFLSDTPFTSVTISAPGGFTYTLDTLIYGDRGEVEAQLPEPSSWMMMIAGFGAVGASLRQRKRQTVRFA